MKDPPGQSHSGQAGTESGRRKWESRTCAPVREKAKCISYSTFLECEFQC